MCILPDTFVYYCVDVLCYVKDIQPYCVGNYVYKEFVFKLSLLIIRKELSRFD